MSSAAAKPIGASGTYPGKRNPAAIARFQLALTSKPLGILHALTGYVENLMKAQFLSLVDVAGTRQGENQQGRRLRPSKPQFKIQIGVQTIFYIPAVFVAETIGRFPIARYCKPGRM